jgi:tRNA A-37 threonylcarbamoyl transferase component Bud32
MSNLLGQSLGRYHILEQLGEGGMAVVYKAYDTRLERDVAVKVIRTEKLTLETMTRTLKRFEREAKALAKLTHPNIVPITDYGEHDGKPYLVMPYLPGGTLKQRLKGKPMPWQDAVRLLIPIARALHYAHQQGIIHRDVKPSNILITQSGEPMLTDFGIAKILLDNEETADLTGTGMGVGTPEYMSPEQFQGKGVDARTDVYSLGVVLYEMVTGRKPYQADTPAAVLIKQVTEPLPRPCMFVPDLPAVFEKMLIKAMAKNSEDRYQNMGELTATLEGLLSGGGALVISAPPPVARRSASSLSPDQTTDTLAIEAQEDTAATVLQPELTAIRQEQLTPPAEEARLDALFDESLAAYQREEWAKAKKLLQEVARKHPGYRRGGQWVEGLLAEAERRLTMSKREGLVWYSIVWGVGVLMFVEGVLLSRSSIAIIKMFVILSTVFLLSYLFLPQKNCPECGNPLPKYRIPENKRQVFWGGWTCPYCGCEVDSKGKKVEK